MATVVAPDSWIVRLGGRTSDLPFFGTLGETSFLFRRPGRNSFKPIFVVHIHESSGATAVDIEARNIFRARNPVVLFATVLAIGLVSGAALTSGRGIALTVLVLGAAVFGALYFGIGWWQETDIRQVFALIERVVGASSVDEARSIGRTV
jgi:hypothetical protein